MSHKKSLLIAFVSTLFAVFYQEYNQYSLNNQFPSQNGLITCADESSYLRPPQNWLEIGEWKDNSKSITSFFLRPPGYGLFFLTCKTIYNDNPWIILKIFQISAFFLSVFIFSRITTLLFSKKWAIYSSLIYGLLPCFSGFMYFTITESITPFVLLAVFFFNLKCIFNYKKSYLILFCLAAAYLLLLRPQLGIFIALFHFSFIFHLRRNIFFWSILLYLPFLFWSIRATVINKSYPGLHPIYSYTNNGMFRPSHRVLTDLYRVWEYVPENFHAVAGALTYDTTENAINTALLNVPQKFHIKIIPLLKEYQSLHKYRFIHFKNYKMLNGPHKGELEFEKHIKLLQSELIKKYPIDYYLKTPLLSLWKQIKSSHLNLKIFQYDFRGEFWMEILRWACLFVVMFSVIFSMLYVITIKYKNMLFFTSLAIFIFMFYLSYIQRMNEERYITPILPIAFILSIKLVSMYLKNIKEKKVFTKTKILS
ncbi:MAG: hypothetical protein HYU67_10810 [Flavobacteriia bacterium]|nr:hypothetical protein [Flavobacteriia bacterium]